MSFVANPKWFWGIVDQPGLWATAAIPGKDFSVRDYKCAQDMNPTWVAYLGQPPEIATPVPVTAQEVVQYLDQDTLPPNPNSSYYPDKTLADLVSKLFDTSSTIDILRARIRGRVKTTT
jgi:hypothetical protein